MILVVSAMGDDTLIFMPAVGDDGRWVDVGTFYNVGAAEGFYECEVAEGDTVVLRWQGEYFLSVSGGGCWSRYVGTACRVLVNNVML